MRVSTVLPVLTLVCLWGWPGVQAAEAPDHADNVIVVTMDGFRHQEFFGGAELRLMDKKSGGVRDVDDLKKEFWRDSPQARRETLLPFIWGTLARTGQIFGDRGSSASARLTNGMKFSYPGYNEIFCGFGDPRIDSNDKRTNPNRSVLEFLNDQPAFHGRVAAYCTWDVFSWIFRADQNGLRVSAGWTPIRNEPLSDRQRVVNTMIDQLPRYWPDNVYDAVAMEAAREHVVRHKPRVLYIALGETDEWAHGRRYDLYLQAAHRVDHFVGSLWKTLQEMPEYRDKTALIMTTDHGRGSTPIDWTDHGRKVEGAEYMWIAVMGAGVPSLGVRTAVETTQSQVAATIAALLGEDFVSQSPKSAPPLPGVCPSRP